MRGIVRTLSLLPSARVVLAGAAILAGAFTAAAQGQTLSGSIGGNGTETKGSEATDSGYADEAAWASAHFGHGGASRLPRPLRPSDAAVARRIFTLQAHGGMAEAAALTAQLDDTLLLGPILADRYLGRYHRSSADELTAWLDRYGDTADAPAVYALLLRRLPPGAARPPAPSVTGLDRGATPDPVPENADEPHRGLPRDPALDRAVMNQAQRGALTAAQRLIDPRARLSDAYRAQLRAEVAQIAFIRGNDPEASAIAAAALENLPEASRPSLAYYVGGLAAWRQQRFDHALDLFAAGAKAPITTQTLKAATAFWASRAARRLHEAAAAKGWLRRAAEQPLTFHGFLARRILHMPTGIVPSGQLLSQADTDAVAATSPGRRAFGLLQVGQSRRAEAELRLLWPQAQQDPAFARSLLLVASAAGLTDFAAQMADQLQAAEGVRYDELRFPLPRLRPTGGFRVDPAIVYALTRLESNFDAAAISPAGAHGLMQIMPATAQYITGDDQFQPIRLHEPATNLEIGQRYVTLLARQDGIDNDLIRLLASYNWGPTNLVRWEAESGAADDPLLFIETIPAAETRAFVPTALVYTWIYAARLHLPAPSLDALAAGLFPRFTQDTDGRRIASAAPVLH